MPLDSGQHDISEPMDASVGGNQKTYIDGESLLEQHCGHDPRTVTKYPFIRGQIPRLKADDKQVDSLIMLNKPVVITETKLVESAKNWNLQYLEENMGQGKNFVFCSETRRFKYHDEKRLQQWPNFKRPTTRYSVTFTEFITMLNEARRVGQKIYLQQTLNDSVGTSIVQDFIRFKWDWCTKYQRMCRWGSLTSNLLLVGMEGNVTPTHYDEQENFFAQISGYKHCVLFPPDQFQGLYPYPVSHPCDRQSQVDIDDPDLDRFPKFRHVQAVETIVGPGEVLYIPMYWWHNIESVGAIQQQPPSGSQYDVPVTISVNFWYKAPPVSPRLERPLIPHQRVAVMRNIEKMLNEVLGDPRDVGDLLRTVVDGRYEETVFDSSVS